MKMLRAIIRPEKADHVAEALLEKGFPAMTRMDVYGRGKQMGLQIGSAFYDELPKQMIMIVVQDEDEETVANIIMEIAFTTSFSASSGTMIFNTLLFTNSVLIVEPSAKRNETGFFPRPIAR